MRTESGEMIPQITENTTSFQWHNVVGIVLLVPSSCVRGESVEEQHYFVPFLLRSHQKKLYPKMWNIPAGHIEDGEDVLDATKRELFEETGLDEAGLEKISNFTFKDGNGDTHKLFNVQLFAKLINGNSKFSIRLSDEHEAFGYIPLEKMDKLETLTMRDMIFTDLKQALISYRRCDEGIKFTPVDVVIGQKFCDVLRKVTLSDNAVNKKTKLDKISPIL